MSDNPDDSEAVRAEPKRDYEVGYGRPPVATRFRPGGVGNPKGRPKSAKTVGRIIEDALMTPVKIEANGKPKTMPAMEVIILNLVHRAARGDLKAIRILFAHLARHPDSAEATDGKHAERREPNLPDLDKLSTEELVSLYQQEVRRSK